MGRLSSDRVHRRRAAARAIAARLGHDAATARILGDTGCSDPSTANSSRSMTTAARTSRCFAKDADAPARNPGHVHDDLLSIDGEDVTQAPYSERRTHLEALDVNVLTGKPRRRSTTLTRRSRQCAGTSSRGSWRSDVASAIGHVSVAG
jgi:hypothetical protein